MSEKKALISCIAHGNVRRQKAAKRSLHRLLSPDYRLVFQQTNTKHHAIALAEAAVLANSRYLIAIGGDGTVNEVINGYLQAPVNKRKHCTLGILPIGTGNDFAASLKLKPSVRQLVGLIQKQSLQNIDIGRVSYSNHDGNIETRYFNNITDLGLGSLVVASVARSRKLLGSSLTFILAVVKNFFGYQHQEVRLIAPKLQWEGKIVSLCIAIGRYYGGGLGIAPHAQTNDGRLAVTIVGDVKVRHFLRFLGHLRYCRPIPHPQVSYYHVESCEITALSDNCLLDLDGEFVGYPPLHIKLIDEKVPVLAPETIK